MYFCGHLYTNRTYEDMKDATKAKIIEAATELFCKVSFAKVSLRLISKKAGLSHSLVHRYWASKEDLFADCMVEARYAFYGKYAAHGPKVSYPLLMNKLLHDREQPIFLMLRQFLGCEAQSLLDAVESYNNKSENKGSYLDFKNLPEMEVEGCPELNRDSFMLMSMVMLVTPFEKLLTPYVGTARAERAEDNLIHAFLRLAYGMKIGIKK